MYLEWKNKTIEEKKLVHKQNFISKNDSEKPLYVNTKLNNGVYSTNNSGKYFLSIDLKAANFQVLKLNGLINENSWSEYLAKFIPHPYFAKLKKLRLKCFSFPEIYSVKQKIYWQNITLTILDSIIENNIMLAENFAVFNSDEIVFHTTKEDMINDKIRCKEFIDKMFPIYETAIDIFQLFQVSPGKPYFVKMNIETNKPTFKCVNATLLPEAIGLWLDKQKELTIQ